MYDIMQQAKNAIEAYNTALKVTSSNIANMNVPGYKKLGVSFQSVFEKVLAQGSAAETDSGGTNPFQLGQGMAISGTSVDFSTGETTSGSALDLAVSGQGMYIVSPDGGTTFLYTRAGGFKLDSAGNLTINGLQVYGLNSSNCLVPITGLSGYNPNLLSWTTAGELAEFTDDKFTSVNRYTPYKIALTYFPNPSGLVQTQGTAFAETLASGSAATPQSVGGTVGSVLPRQLEQSNVNYLSETINAMELQRAMSGQLSMLKMASDLISSFIQKLG